MRMANAAQARIGAVISKAVALMTTSKKRFIHDDWSNRERRRLLGYKHVHDSLCGVPVPSFGN